MPGRKVWEVEPRGACWVVQREGADRADSAHARQQDAIERGTELAKAAHGQLRIKGVDGKIRDERTYGQDSYPPER
jgi:hypothetical protein